MKKLQLFTNEQAPRFRKPRKWLMHFYDVGPSPYVSESGKEAFYVHWKCKRCGHDDDWSHFEGTVSDVKRGIPCPKCNGEEE